MGMGNSGKTPTSTRRAVPNQPAPAPAPQHQQNKLKASSLRGTSVIESALVTGDC